MAGIKVRDIAYGRLRAPDLDVMEEFLTEFGMSRAARTNDALYMRGTDPDHHIHITEKGDTGFVGFAYNAASEDDLKRLSKLSGASGIETVDEPGGGKRVRLTEPNGYQIEVIWGQEMLDPIPVRYQKINSGPEAEARAKMPLRVIIPAFMISELRRAFEIGFLIFVPFLIIDMVVASVLMALGMMMLPPIIIALPFKIIFFVLVDGWFMVVGSLIRSFGG